MAMQMQVIFGDDVSPRGMEYGIEPGIPVV